MMINGHTIEDMNYVRISFCHSYDVHYAIFEQFIDVPVNMDIEDVRPLMVKKLDELQKEMNVISLGKKGEGRLK